MADVSTRFLGMSLRNPLIIAASGLTSTPEGAAKAAAAGAGAAVLKSLFEEQLLADMRASGAAALESHPEASALLDQLFVQGGAGEYLDLIRRAKEAVAREGGEAAAMPLIASVNCVSGERWIDFAEQIAAAGADALELNIGSLSRSTDETSQEIEDRIVGIVRDVSVRAALPLAVKLGPYLTSPAHLVERLAGAGAGAVVLFNRFYRLDVDLASFSLKSGPMRSGPDEYLEPLRWIANLYGAVGCELVAGTGVHSGDTALKLIAVGAGAVQLCSAVYARGWSAVGACLDQMHARLDQLKQPSLAAFRGKLARRSSLEPERYERLQYIKALTGTL